MAAAFHYCVVIFLAAISVTVVLCENDSISVSKWGENTIGKDEALCRRKLHETPTMFYYLLASGICSLSVIFLLLSIGVFFYVQRYLMREMDEAVFKCQDVMDACMVSLIPTSLLDDIGEKENKKKDN